MAVKINKQKTASAASEKKTDAASESAKKAASNAGAGTKFEKGKKVKGEKSDKRAERSHKFTARIEKAAALILSQKLTDEQIIEQVSKEFTGYPTVFNQKEVGRTRWMLRHDMLPNVHTDGRCFDRCYLIEGKLVPRAEKPKTTHAKRKAKYNAESDPLNKIAGVNVHKKEKSTSGDKSETAKKTPIKKAKKAAEASSAASSSAASEGAKA